MKYLKGCVLFLIISINSFGQRSVFPNLEDAIKAHVLEFKENIRHYDSIFIYLEMRDSLRLPKNVFFIVDPLNAKILKKGNHDFYIRIVLDNRDDTFKVNMINFRIYKQSNRRLKLVNMGNGRTYYIKPRG